MNHREIHVHRDLALLAAGVVLAASLLQVLPNGRVALIGLAEHPLPPACLSWSLFGVKCPGCGLTRSFVHLFHGDVRASWESHRLGWLLALVIAGQIPYRIAVIRHPGRFRIPPPWTSGAFYGVLTLLLLNWVVGLLIV